MILCPTCQELACECTLEQRGGYREGFFVMGFCRIIVTIDAGRWHLSISKAKELPSYEELKRARYEYLPDNIEMAQIFPPKSDFVNAHPYCLHLWEVKTNKL